MSTSLAKIQKDAVAALRRYAQSDESADLREVAGLFIDARMLVTTREGDPDYLGRTHAYRRWVRETMTLANVPGDKLASLQAAIRYHTGNILRARLDEGELQSLGLKAAGPRERSVEKRERYSETLAIFGGGAELATTEEILAASQMIELALRRVSLYAVKNLSKDDAAKVSDAMDAACKHAEAIAEAARAGGKRARK